MICPHCEANVAEGVQYCPSCGADISEAEAAEGKVEAKIASQKNKRKKHVKLAALCVFLLLIAVAVVFIFFKFSSNEGERIAVEISDKIGRSIALAEKNANVELSETSGFSILKEVVNYDYVYESEKSVKVEGIHLPKWIIYVENDSNDRIKSVSFYDYTVLEGNWKGHKLSEKEDISSIAYGTSLKDVQKILGYMKPLAVMRSNDDTTLYRYKYYYIDSETKDEHSYYLDIVYDVDNNVKSISQTENEYMAYILK